MSLAICWVFIGALLIGTDAQNCGGPAMASSSASAMSEGAGSATATSIAQAEGGDCPPPVEIPSLPTQTFPDRPTIDRPTIDRPSTDRPSIDRPTPDRPAEKPVDLPDTGSSGAPDSGSGVDKKDFERFDGIAGEVQDAILKSSVEGVAKALDTSNDIKGLAKGFTFKEENRDAALKKTDRRQNDGDVVSIKGIAKSAFRTGDVDKLAKVMVRSVKPEGGDYPVDPGTLIDELKQVLSDRKTLARIISADPTKELLRRMYTRRRHMMCNACTPANSYVCAHCWPKKVCKKFWWC